MCCIEHTMISPALTGTSGHNCKEKDRTIDGSTAGKMKSKGGTKEEVRLLGER